MSRQDLIEESKSHQQTRLDGGYADEEVEDDEEKVAICRELANEGHPDAQFYLGLCYAEGKGVMKDQKEAVTWFYKAANQGHPDAQARLGRCYAEGEGVEKDQKEAVTWYQKAANQDHAGAQFDLSMCYAKGEGVAKDNEEATSWFRKAARHAPVFAQMLKKFDEKGNRNIQSELSDNEHAPQPEEPYHMDSESNYQLFKDDESVGVNDPKKDCIDYINFLSDNRVIVRLWKKDEQARVKCEHVSLEIPHKKFYRAVGIEKENGREKARFITSYDEDRNEIMRRKPDRGISLFHLNTDLIIEAANKHRLEHADYNKYINTSSAVDNDLLETFSLNCAMFVRSILEHGGLNTLVNMRKRRSFVGRTHFFIIAFVLYGLMKTYSFTDDQNLQKAVETFVGLSSCYSLVPSLASGARFVLGHRWIHTTPRGVFNLCQEAVDHEIEEMENIILDSTNSFSECLSKPRGIFKLLGLILGAAIGKASGALGAKVLSINHTGYDAKICAKVTAVGMSMTLPIAEFFKFSDQIFSKERIEKLGPPQKLIKSTRSNLIDQDVPDGKMAALDGIIGLLMTVYTANISGTLLIKHLSGEEMPITNSVYSYIVGTLIIAAGFLCLFIKGFSCYLGYKACQEEKERIESNRFNILDHAIKTNDDFVLDFLMKSSLNLKYINGGNISSLLINAIKQSNAKNVSQLIEVKANVNCTRQDMHTPLSIAACQGHLLITQRLVEAKADINKRIQGKTALEWAQQRDNDEVASYLQSVSHP